MKSFKPKISFIFRYLGQCVALVGYLTKYNQKWDSHVNLLMDHGKCVQLDDYTISFELDGERTDLWIANPFYSYAHPRHRCPTWAKSDYRPSIHTMFRLDKYIKGLQG